MSRRVWTKPFVKTVLSGDQRKARSLERKARSYIGYLFDQMGDRQKYRTGSWNLTDGSRITAFVWRDILGERAKVEIYSPSIAPINILEGFGFIYIPVNSIYPGGINNTISPDFFSEINWEGYWRNVIIPLPKNRKEYKQDVNWPYYGNVEWIGRKKDVLSFFGPHSRYFYADAEITPAAPLTEWNYIWFPLGRIFKDGDIFADLTNIIINGCCFFYGENGKDWIIVSSYSYTGKVSIYIAEVTNKPTPYTKADFVKILEIDTTWEDCPYYNTVSNPRTITTFNRAGNKGAFTTCDGQIYRLSFTEELGSLSCTYTVEREGLSGFTSNFRKYTQTEGLYFTDGQTIGAKNVITVSYWGSDFGGSGPCSTALSFLPFSTRAVGSYEGWSNQKDYWINQDNVDSTIDAYKIPLAIDFDLDTQEEKIAYITLNKGLESTSTSWSITEYNLDSPSVLQRVFKKGRGSCDINRYKTFVYMPDGERYVLEDTSRASHSAAFEEYHLFYDGTVPAFQIPQIVDYTTIKEYKLFIGGSIQYMDLRFNSIFVSKNGGYNRDTVTDNIYYNYPYPTTINSQLVRGYKVETETESTSLSSSYAILQDSIGPDIEMGNAGFTDKDTVITETIDPIITDGEIVFGSLYPGSYEMIDESTPDQEVFLTYGIDNAYFSFGEPMPWSSNQQIKYSQNGHRFFSVYDRFADKIWYNVLYDQYNKRNIDLTKFFTFDATEGNSPHANSVALFTQK